MDGGFDAAIINKFGVQLMHHVQEKILQEYAGEQPVGTSLIIETGNERHKYLAHTPTMRTPKPIIGTDNIYNAMRAMLLAVQKHNDIKTVLCPGLGTATGQMPPDIAAKQMYLAYQSIKYPPKTINWEMAINRERRLW